MSAVPGPTCIQEAAQAKDAGNAAFAAGRFEEAYAHYSEAIRIDPASALLRSNRAGALASMGRHTEALNDADMCVSLRPDWWKSFTRRGHAQFQLGRFAEAEASFTEALRLNPQERSIAEALERAAQRRATAPPTSSAPSLGPRAAGAAVPFAPPVAPWNTVATEAVDTGDWQKLNDKEIRERLERSINKLSDAQLDDELVRAGLYPKYGASRADKIQLYLR
ncbi:unnamed protein product, partial [Polarella glacialis]